MVGELVDSLEIIFSLILCNLISASQEFGHNENGLRSHRLLLLMLSIPRRIVCPRGRSHIWTTL